MEKEQKSGFGIVGIIIIIAAVAVLGGAVFYPKRMIVGGPSGLISPQQTYYSEKYQCLGFKGQICPSAPYADISCEQICYGLRYKKQCFKSVGAQNRTIISCDEIPRKEPPPPVSGEGRNETEVLKSQEGVFHIMYGDPSPGSDTGSISHFLINDDGKLTYIKINSYTSIMGVDSVIDLVKKRVNVTGRFYPEKNIFEATSIKLIEDAEKN